MSEKQKKTNKKLTTYEYIHSKLEKVVKTYLTTQEPYYFREFILDQRARNKTGLKNSLIEIPKGNIMDILEKKYIEENNIDGEIGIISPEDQLYGIKNIALLMLMSNRLSKVYEKELSHNRTSDRTERQRYTKNRANLLSWKCNAISDLISNIYVLEKLEGYSEIFSYGEIQDNNGKEAFVIDLPYVGQISVHFGDKKEEIIEEAKNKTISILDRKKELGQIDEEKYKETIDQIQDNTILPSYTGKLYEHISALPIEYIGKHTKGKIQEIGLDKKLPEEIVREDIEKMMEIGLNEREAYYLAIKLGYPKKQLKEVIQVYSERVIQSEDKIGKEAVRMTTAQERASVLQYENRSLQKYRENINGKVMGG